MESFMYYLFSALGVGGAFGLLFSRGYVNAAMSMLVSVLGIAGLLFAMGAFFLSFVMLVVYAGAVMVLFVFVVMLVGDEPDRSGWGRRISALGMWMLLCAALSCLCLGMPEARLDGPAASGALSDAKLYGALMFTKFLPMFEIAGAILLVAMTGVIILAKDPSPKRPKRDML